MMQTYSLLSGDIIPVIGLGTLQPPENCEKAVRYAIEVGFRHIDTATFYNNFEQIKKAIKTAGVKRKDLFITSKVWHDSLKYESVINDCRRGLDALGLEYFDLFMIHWPSKVVSLHETYEALHELYLNGMIRNIGVSNFNLSQLRNAKDIFNAVPLSVVQDEFHPYYRDDKKIGFCRRHRIIFTAYSPFCNGLVFNDEAISYVAQQEGKTVAQVILRWLYDKKIAMIPMSSNFRHIEANKSIFDFTLSSSTTHFFDSLNVKQRARNY